MSTMPYWLNKTPEMIAMDRYFSAGPNLVERYKKTINKINAGLPGSSDALNLGMTPDEVADAFTHFDKDWLNKTNPSSGGNYWPHVPTFTIVTWFKQGILAAAQKGLGRIELGNIGVVPDPIFDSEKKYSGLQNADLDGVLPLSTSWVCTSAPGTGTVEVDAVRGPSVVELVISTPWPKTMQSRLWGIVQPLLDELWIQIHGPGPVIDIRPESESDDSSDTSKQPS